MRWSGQIGLVGAAAFFIGCGNTLPPAPVPAPTPTVSPTPAPTPAPRRAFLFVHESGGMTGYEVDARSGLLTQTAFLAGPDELVPQPGGNFAFWFHCRNTSTCAFHTYAITD